MSAARAAKMAREGAARRPGVAWGALGFLAGAAFWHAVGFWGFIAEAVLNSKTEARAVAALSQVGPAALPAAAPIPLPTFYMVETERCTVLALDRLSNRTHTLPCPQEGLALRMENGSAREDLAALTTGPTLQPAGYRPD